jgi:RNA polymerase sigma-70 factor (ECF subfamily)
MPGPPHLRLALPREGDLVCDNGMAPVGDTPSPGLLLVPPALVTDEALAERLLEGDADALAALFERHSRWLCRFARRILGSEAEAEDVVQQSFFAAYRAIDQFDRAKGSFRNWLLVLTYRRALNHRRHLATRGVAVAWEDDLPLCEPGGPGAGDAALETRILLAQLMESLKPAQRRAIDLIYYQGLTAEEAAARTGESARAVRHHLYRGLETLRKRLRQTKCAGKESRP